MPPRHRLFVFFRIKVHSSPPEPIFRRAIQLQVRDNADRKMQILREPAWP
ncbi:NACHT and WD40 domain protein [Aspergillus luchuensis]|uniref:NACHT and WD40 domain protein n=1 Tax=Aspergillus kawachii TaxID=1069201 RepID=A0A146FBL6_ASPKA|nr:NACHT and WD40 domain protein [Aspergillus luchuensis]